MGWGERKPFLNAKIVKQAMFGDDKTVTELASEIGVSLPTLSGWLNYRRKPRNQYIQRLSEVLEVPPARLLISPDKATDKMLEKYSEHVDMVSRYRYHRLRMQGIHNIDVREAFGKQGVAQSAVAAELGMERQSFSAMLRRCELSQKEKDLLLETAAKIMVKKAHEQEHLRELAVYKIASHGLTQIQVANAAGVPISTLNRWLTGRVAMTTAKLGVITDAVRTIETEE